MSEGRGQPPRRRREPRDSPGLFGAVALLYLVSIPWWFGSGEPRLLFGMPSWAVVSLLATLGVSCLVAFAALRRWDDGPAPDPRDPERRPPAR